jgi:hypothetical protein
MVIDAQEQSVNDNCKHDNILKGLGLDNFEALES